MKIILSHRVKEKLADKHGGVSIEEIRECFANRGGEFLADARPDHLTNPITRWFIAETNSGRLLKVCFVQMQDTTTIKTAYKPNDAEISLYEKLS